MFGKKLYQTVKGIKKIYTIELFTRYLEVNSVFILIYMTFRFKLKFALHHVPFQQYVILCNHNNCDEITKLLTLI